MINAHFYTPIGEFVATFADTEEVYNRLGSEWIFSTPQGEPLVIPMDVQKNSVIVVKEVN